MIGLGLKILGIGLAGSALSYGAYVGISEDMKWKASIDYPAYYWNKYYRKIYSGITDEEKWKKLYESKKSSVDTQYGNYKSEFSNLGEDWKKYRQWCLTYLREYVMNGKGAWSVLNNNCVFDYSLRVSITKK